MKKIPLTQGKFALVDDTDFGWLSDPKFTWHAGNTKWGIYAKGWRKNEDGTRDRVRMHQLILPCPPGLEPDHQNGDTLDNRRRNLRPATAQQNGFNRSKHKDGSSSYKGVSWKTDKQKWRARISVGGTETHLGDFLSEENAAREYDRAATVHHGVFARLNFPVKELASISS